MTYIKISCLLKQKDQIGQKENYKSMVNILTGQSKIKIFSTPVILILILMLILIKKKPPLF